MFKFVLFCLILSYITYSIVAVPLTEDVEQHSFGVRDIAARYGVLTKTRRPIYGTLPAINRPVKNLRLPTLFRAARIPHQKGQITQVNANPIVRPVITQRAQTVMRPTVTAKRATLPKMEQMPEDEEEQMEMPTTITTTTTMPAMMMRGRAAATTRRAAPMARGGRRGAAKKEEAEEEESDENGEE